MRSQLDKARRLFRVAAVGSLLALGVLVAPAVLAQATTGASEDGQAQRLPAPDPYFGMHMHRASDGTAWPVARIGSWRLWDAYVGWPDLEPAPGRWDFRRLDRYVAMARLTGVDLLLPLGRTPRWASSRPTEKSSYGLGEAAEPADIEHWRRYVRAVAERYRGRIRHFDLWNEVNEKGFYSGSVEKLVQLTCEAHRIVHEVSAENRLVSPSFIGSGSEPDQLENFLRLGGRACVDIIGYHFYVPHREPEEIVPLVLRVKSVMARQGLAKMPLWNTEAGWWMENADRTPESGADPRWRRVLVGEGAAVVTRSLVLGRWAGLERFYWYAWDNQALGLMEPTSKAVKPGGAAMATLIRWMAFSRPDCVETRGRWVCELPAADGRNRRILWQAGGAGGAFIVPSGERVEALERLDGTGLGPGGAPGPTIAIGPEPVLLVTRRQP